ncbi:MAG: hypothetical protein EBR12_03795 [Proteobacteria bacterium]|nr:hypothetical protein [Pseudomonadota bacterium]
MGATQRFWPSFISPLSARILAIMLLPLALFFIGLFSIDQYRSVLVRAEFDALERQGMTHSRRKPCAISCRLWAMDRNFVPVSFSRKAR